MHLNAAHLPFVETVPVAAAAHALHRMLDAIATASRNSHWSSFATKARGLMTSACSSRRILGKVCAKVTSIVLAESGHQAELSLQIAHQ